MPWAIKVTFWINRMSLHSALSRLDMWFPILPISLRVCFLRPISRISFHIQHSSWVPCNRNWLWSALTHRKAIFQRLSWVHRTKWYLKDQACKKPGTRALEVWLWEPSKISLTSWLKFCVRMKLWKISERCKKALIKCIYCCLMKKIHCWLLTVVLPHNVF